MACKNDKGLIKFLEESKNFTAQTEELRKLTFTQGMVTLIKNEIGNFYEDLGTLLGVREGDLDDIETRYSRPTEKGGAVLKNWRDREGPQATVGRLETALNRLGKKRIAVMLLDIAREEKRTEDGSEEHRKTFSSPLEEGETGQRQDSERGFPETMPSSAVEPANAPRKRNVEQRERRAETGSEQGKLDELRESIEKVRDMRKVVTKLDSKVDELPRRQRNTGRNEPLITMRSLMTEVAALKEVIEKRILECIEGIGNYEVLGEMYEKVRKMKEDFTGESWKGNSAVSSS